MPWRSIHDTIKLQQAEGLAGPLSQSESGNLRKRTGKAQIGGERIMQMPIISKYISALRVNDCQGRVLDMEDRYSATMIFPIQGKICFTANGVSTMADSAHPVYISRGTGYRNECLEAASSIMFNFLDDIAPGNVCPLPKAPEGIVGETLWEIQKAQASGTDADMALILSRLYFLLYQLLCKEDCPEQDVLSPALELIGSRFADSSLCLDDLADAAHISKVYLGKRFVGRYGQSPMRYLREVRMKHAADYLREKRPVGEVAQLVGYADIYQFSRAFKKSFGISPSAYLHRLFSE